MGKLTRVAVLQGVFLLASVVKVLQLLPYAQFTERILLDSAILVAPVLVGVLTGERLLHRIPAEALRKASLLLLLVLGVLLLVLPWG
jgi:uncharacterized membrane protein YfcA